mgnify:CR=1 FL=1
MLDRSMLLQPVPEVHPLQKLHHDIEGACGELAVVVERDGVRVAQAARVEDFAAKSLDFIRKPRGFRAQHLYGDVPPHHLLMSAIDDAVAPLSDLRDQAVFGCDQLSDFWESRVHRFPFPWWP